MSKLIIATIQTNLHWENPTANLDMFTQKIAAPQDVKKLPLGMIGIKVEATNTIDPKCIKFNFLKQFKTNS